MRHCPGYSFFSKLDVTKQYLAVEIDPESYESSPHHMYLYCVATTAVSMILMDLQAKSFKTEIALSIIP